jgi:hypothetical protein
MCKDRCPGLVGGCPDVGPSSKSVSYWPSRHEQSPAFVPGLGYSRSDSGILASLAFVLRRPLITDTFGDMVPHLLRQRFEVIDQVV